MLLELLEHHEGLFTAAVWPLIWRRDCRSLAALSATCGRLREYLLKLPHVQHTLKFKRSLSSIKHINILYNKYVTIRECGNKLAIYWCWREYKINRRIISDYYIYSFPKRVPGCLRHGKRIKYMRVLYSDHMYIKINGIIPDWIKKYEELIEINYNKINYSRHIFEN
jgi:hypothetical protein